jgi:hypothetical protein
MAIDEEPPIPEYVTLREAARLLSVPAAWLYQRISCGEIPAQMVDFNFLIALKDIEAFRSRHFPGQPLNLPTRPSARLAAHPQERPRRDNMRGMYIQVQIKEGCRDLFNRRLRVLRDEQIHTFTTAILCNIFCERDDPDTVIIWLVWREPGLIDEITRKQEIAAFMAATKDIVDWDTALYNDMRGMLYV